MFLQNESVKCSWRRIKPPSIKLVFTCICLQEFDMGFIIISTSHLTAKMQGRQAFISDRWKGWNIIHEVLFIHSTSLSSTPNFFSLFRVFRYVLLRFPGFSNNFWRGFLRSKLIESEDKFKWEAISASHSHKSKSHTTNRFGTKTLQFQTGTQKGRSVSGKRRDRKLTF